MIKPRDLNATVSNWRPKYGGATLTAFDRLHDNQLALIELLEAI